MIDFPIPKIERMWIIIRMIHSFNTNYNFRKNKCSTQLDIIEYDARNGKRILSYFWKSLIMHYDSSNTSAVATAKITGEGGKNKIVNSKGCRDLVFFTSALWLIVFELLLE